MEPIGESFIRSKEVCTNDFRISLSMMDDVFLFLQTIEDLILLTLFLNIFVLDKDSMTSF